MFIEVIDQLRCVTPHEDSWLVATFLERDGRFIIEGALGCPICQREYRIHNGVAYFGNDVASQAAPSDDAPDPDPMAAAAFLDAAEGVTIVLGGTWATTASAIVDMLPMRAFTMNAPQSVSETEHIIPLHSTEGIPLAPHSVRGIALDNANATEANITTASKVLTPRGRLVVPAHIPVPTDMSELARDEHYWVAEKREALIPLRRA